MILTPCPTQQIERRVGGLPTAGYCGDRNNANDGYINWQRYPSLKKFQDNLRANLTAQEGGKVQVRDPSRRGVPDRRRSGCRSRQHGRSGDVRSTCCTQRAASPAHKTDYNVTPAR